MKTFEFHMEQAEEALRMAEASGTTTENVSAFTRSAMAHIQFASALAAKQASDAVLAIQFHVGSLVLWLGAHKGET